jgi:hypothetical protein
MPRVVYYTATTFDGFIADPSDSLDWLFAVPDAAEAEAGLLDEIVLSVAPVTLGSGRSLLPRRLESDRLTLTSVRQVGQFAELTYSVENSGR